MPSKRIDFDVVRKIALALPGVVEGTIHGQPAWRVGGRLLACPAIHRSAEAGSLAVRIDFDRREELIAAQPDTFYVTEHYLASEIPRAARNRLGEGDRHNLPPPLGEGDRHDWLRGLRKSSQSPRRRKMSQSPTVSTVLVRLDRIDRQALKKLLTEARQFVGESAKARGRKAAKGGKGKKG